MQIQTISSETSTNCTRFKAILINEALIIMNIFSTIIFAATMSLYVDTVAAINIMKVVLSISLISAFIKSLTIKESDMDIEAKSQPRLAINALLRGALAIFVILGVYITRKPLLLEIMPIESYAVLGYSLIFSIINYLLFSPSLTKFFIIKAVLYDNSKSNN